MATHLLSCCARQAKIACAAMDVPFDLYDKDIVVWKRWACNVVCEAGVFSAYTLTESDHVSKPLETAHRYRLEEDL